LSEKEQWNELFLTGLRTKWGVSKSAIESLNSFSKAELNLLQHYTSDGSMIETASSFILTDAGKIRADGIASSFFRV
jgi:oxygen-independent coproporphyrinogen-3 oxidase